MFCSETNNEWCSREKNLGKSGFLRSYCVVVSVQSSREPRFVTVFAGERSRCHNHQSLKEQQKRNPDNAVVKARPSKVTRKPNLEFVQLQVDQLVQHPSIQDFLTPEGKKSLANELGWLTYKACTRRGQDMPRH
jgi:hypothetical protein